MKSVVILSQPCPSLNVLINLEWQELKWSVHSEDFILSKVAAFRRQNVPYAMFYCNTEV